MKEELTSIIISEIHELAPDVKSFTLLPDEPLSYKPGQFLTFLFRDEHGEERRSYSLTSSPALNEPLSICIKRVDNGRFSRPLIDKASPGDTLLATRATGQFTLPEDLHNYRQFFFLAAGIGITPIYSLIKTLLHDHPDKEVILIYSNSNQEKAVFYQELLDLHKQYPQQFRLEFLFSSSPDLTKARLSKWLLPQLLNIYASENKSEQLFYTCGPFAYMRMVIIGLEEAGYHRSQIRRELFDTSRPTPRLQPPDKETHLVTFNWEGNQHTFPVTYPQTILQAARAHGLPIPFSCETGRCGSCTMHCTEGKVWMSYNEVLTDNDLAQGKILTCVGHPIFGNVKIE